MTLDDGLLEKSREAASRLAEAEPKSSSRADYYTAVRRLHPRRVAEEIAKRSTQSPAGPRPSSRRRWWRRVWRTEPCDEGGSRFLTPPGKSPGRHPNASQTAAAAKDPVRRDAEDGGSSSAASGGAGRCPAGKEKEVFAATARVCAHAPSAGRSSTTDRLRAKSVAAAPRR
jgi:hypothetical protein